MSEFPVALLVFFFFAVFPLINLMLYAAACATVAFITTQAADSAASQSDYATSLTSMQTVTTNLTNSGWGKFARLTPVGGYSSSGANLWLVETKIVGGATNLYGPNTPDPNAPDPKNNLYEYRVVTNFDIAPFVNLSAVPFIGSVPLIGAVAHLSYTVERNVEYPFTSSAAAGS
jgi:hypothetical protein